MGKVGMASEEALGQSRGVLASEDSSPSESGEAGLLSTCSSGVGGTDESGDSDMMGDGGGEVGGSRNGDFW